MGDAERTLIHEALRFAVWAAGEGIVPVDVDVRAPEDFIYEYASEADLDDWAGIPDRIAALEPAATCNESLQVEPAAPEGQRPVAEALELSGNTGELIDRMAAAIRDWGSHYDDGPWETLPEDRKAGWRGDAERALAVVKEYLTTRRPAEQAVTEAMVEAAQRIRDVAMRQTIAARVPECGEFGGIAQDADWLVYALKAAMETEE